MPSPLDKRTAGVLPQFDHVVQRVKQLRVLPGSRSVRFVLTLTLPTSPIFAVYDWRTGATAADDFKQEPVAVGWGLIFLNTFFDSRLSGMRPERPYRFRIIIPATRSSSPIVLTGNFFTARREITYHIHEINLRSGGSEDWVSGAPDLTFFTALYDAGPPRQRQTPQRTFGELSIWHGRLKQPFGRNGDVVINPPNSVAPYIHAFEDDIGLLESFDTGTGVPHFLEHHGAFDHESDDGPFAGDTQDILLPDDVGEHLQPFTLDTAGKLIDYQASGTIATTVFPPKQVTLGKRRRRSMSTQSGRSNAVKTTVDGVELQAGVADGRLVIARRQRGRSRTEAETSLIVGAPVDARALALATRDARVQIFAGGERGVQAVWLGENTRAAEGWLDLGGPPVDTLSAAAGPDVVDIVAVSPDGRLHHARVPANLRGRADWRQLADGMADAVVVRGKETLLFALSREGAIWSSPLDARDLKRTEMPGPRFAVMTAQQDDDGILIVAIDEAGRVHARADRDASWTDLGPVDLFGLQEESEEVEPSMAQ